MLGWQAPLIHRAPFFLLPMQPGLKPIQLFGITVYGIPNTFWVSDFFI